MVLETRIGNKTSKRRFGKRDQIAPELEYFARCVLRDEEPEPSGWEGLHDVRIIRAILESARTERKTSIDLPDKQYRPGRDQAIERPPVPRSPGLVNAEPPSGELAPIAIGLPMVTFRRYETGVSCRRQRALR